MMPVILGLAFSAVWLLRTARAVAGAVALWQQKEYRLDRMRSHLGMPETVRRALSTLSLLKWALLAAAVLVAEAAFIILFIVAAVYAFETLLFFREVRLHNVHRPQWTAKSALLFLIGLLGVFGISGALALRDPRLVVPILAGDRAVALIVSLGVLAMDPVTRGRKSRIIARARAHRLSCEDLIVIGVTGSYGKSGVKEALTHLLGNDQTVLKTPGNTNTDIGVAQFLLRSLRRQHRYLICEMGAYRQGEIARIADMTRPHIGIVTAVAPQHLALFGSLKDIAEAKYELLAELPAAGTAIVNLDNAITAEFAKITSHCRVVTYGVGAGAQVRARDIRPDAEGTTFTLVTPHGSSAVRLRLLGTHHVSNVLAAAAAAFAVGVPLSAIAARAARIVEQPRSMERFTLRDGTLVIDDSYSANPDGVLAALETLRLLPRRKKVVVLPALMELGEEAYATHRRIGAALGVVADNVFFTQRDYAEDLAAGITESGRLPRDLLVVATDMQSISSRLQALGGADTVLLLEGRIPGTLYARILAQRVASENE